MKRQKKSHKSPKLKTEEERKLHELSGFGHYEVISPLPVFGGRAVIEIPSPQMSLMYSGGDMVEQFKQNGMNIEEIIIPKENPLEDVDKIPLDEYIDVLHYIWIKYLLLQAKHIMERSNRERIHREEETMTKPRSHTFQSVHDIFFLECYEYISNTKDEERINTYSYHYEDYTLQYTTEYAGGRYCLEQVDKIQLQYNYETRHLQIRIIYHDSHINHHTINIADIRTLYNINLTPTKYATKK